MDKNSTIQLISGNQMPILGLGTWQLRDDTAGTVEYALSLGYRLIDTSSDYGTQSGVGQGIRKSGVERGDIYITTKVEEYDDAYRRTQSNLEELGVDMVDLMLIHRPPPTGAGVELWEGLLKGKEEGLIRDIGVSNYSLELIETLITESGEVPAVNQIEWSPFGYSEEMMQYCMERGIVIQAYSPLTRAKRLDDATLTKIAEKYGKSPAQLLIRWNLQQGSVPLPKANQKEHLEENIDAFDFEIEEEDVERLNQLNERYSSLGTLPYL